LKESTSNSWKINDKVCPLNNHVNSMKGKLMSIEDWLDEKFQENFMKKYFDYPKTLKLNYCRERKLFRLAENEDFLCGTLMATSYF
jgi:hypothetical protein